MTPTGPASVGTRAQGSSPTSAFAHRTGEPEPRDAGAHRLYPVVELVVADGGRRDRQVGDLLPRALSPDGKRRMADDEVAEVEPDRGNALALAIEQRDDPAHVPLSPWEARSGSVAAPRSLVESTRSAVPGSGDGNRSMPVRYPATGSSTRDAPWLLA